MLIKQADDHSTELARLESLIESRAGDASKNASKELFIRRAGIKGEKESAYFIDFHYGASPNWAVIHDLRLERNGRTAQIDHLLINRWMECYVLESKHFRDGIKITEDGEFMRWNDYKRTYEGMPSPLQQNERHIAVLGDVMNALNLPTRLGLRIAFSFQSFILVSPAARIDRPAKFDTSRVIKADQLKERIWRDIDNENVLLSFVKAATKIVSSETLTRVAKQLAALHKPTKTELPASASVDPPALPKTESAIRKLIPDQKIDAEAAPASNGPRCKSCASGDGSILYGKYGYYFKCKSCSTNTPIRFTSLPKHNPRLRKAGNQFFRDCEECGSSELYFANA